MFITFEGIDFCGKSTQVELLKKYLTSKKKIVELIREPGGTTISEMVRSILLDKVHENMCNETEIFLFSASRAQLVREKIRPYLMKGYYVISDRFHDSSTAYQGFGRGLSIETIIKIHNLAIGETIPDITFFIDISVGEAENRKRQKLHRELDRIEVSERDFFEKVRNGYLYLSKDKRFRKLDGTQSVQEIHKQIIREIELLEKR
ncbi:MAG TPA: dTMP kinase [Ignavibacteriaceae bacterium]|nr:MAG: dTMP kinase [Ignavibacteria bacterium RBG_16_35_7]